MSLPPLGKKPYTKEFLTSAQTPKRKGSRNSEETRGSLDGCYSPLALPKLAAADIQAKLDTVISSCEGVRHSLSSIKRGVSWSLQKTHQLGQIEPSRFQFDQRKVLQPNTIPEQTETRSETVVKQVLGVTPASENLAVSFQDLATTETAQLLSKNKRNFGNRFAEEILPTIKPVSYTHLTLPTNREV